MLHSFIVCMKTEGSYGDIAKDVKRRFDTSNDILDRPLPRKKNKKMIRLMKDDFGRQY